MPLLNNGLTKRIDLMLDYYLIMTKFINSGEKFHKYISYKYSIASSTTTRNEFRYKKFLISTSDWLSNKSDFFSHASITVRNVLSVLKCFFFFELNSSVSNLYTQSISNLVAIQLMIVFQTNWNRRVSQLLTQSINSIKQRMNTLFLFEMFNHCI